MVAIYDDYLSTLFVVPSEEVNAGTITARKAIQYDTGAVNDAYQTQIAQADKNRGLSSKAHLRHYKVTRSHRRRLIMKQPS